MSAADFHVDSGLEEYEAKTQAMKPVVFNPATMRMGDAYEQPHLHDLTGRCVKNRYGPACSEEPTLRRFALERNKDHSGLSGTGFIAWGVQFPDGKVVTRWDSSMRNAAQTAVWDSLSDMMAIHGHNGDTQVVWID